jgi:DNA-binding GntR family transcriptional regulator
MPIPASKTVLFPKTAKDRVFSVMREWIIDGTLKPGEQIFDKEIAEYFAVSRTPVREAFQMLAEQKLINISPGKESRVTDIDPVSARQSYELLSVLESLAVKYAISNTTEEALQVLEDSIIKLKEAIDSGNPVKANEADHMFHLKILELSGNDFLRLFCETLETHVSRVEILYFSQQDISEILLASVEEHEMILDAIKSGNAEEACRIMAENWKNMILYIEKYINEA